MAKYSFRPANGSPQIDQNKPECMTLTRFTLNPHTIHFLKPFVFQNNFKQKKRGKENLTAACFSTYMCQQQTTTVQEEEEESF